MRHRQQDLVDGHPSVAVAVGGRAGIERLQLEGDVDQGAQARVQVNFEQQGAKWLMLSYANLEVVR